MHGARREDGLSQLSPDKYAMGAGYLSESTHLGFDVFFDYISIPSGDFESVILGNIKSRAHFLVLLTPSALEDCDKPGDWPRREIEAAMGTQRNVIPLMLDGFDFGAPKISGQLTGKLSALSF